MELDKRIINGKRPLTCFDVEEAEKYIGKLCYMCDEYNLFYQLNLIEPAILMGVEDCEIPFHNGQDKQAEFCLPCDWVTKEKKYRPFKNTKEFFIKTNFEAGDVIRVYCKAHNTECHLMLIGWTDDMLMLGNFRGLCFDELFEWFELWDGEERFIPFGVEE